ncbi:hypothetical protein ACF06X_33595 [Streptomyces sp. NPDC015346]|uniref:hypothetical protein n=1 Tax=Streptomyces sp. NPDC015346 TaxID=3364954 RepID=UPI003700F8C7
MTTLSAKERGDMAEALLPIAAHLVTLVHGDGGPRDVHQALARLDATQKDALLVVLAGLVDPDQPMGAALGWLDFNEHGETVVPTWGEKTPLRDLAPDPELEDDYVDEAAIRKYVLGVRIEVTPQERLEAVVRCVARGMTYLEIDAMHGLTKGSTSTFISRTRRAYEQRGQVFPEMIRPDAPRTLDDAKVLRIRQEYAAGGVTDMELAMRYGVARNTITRVLLGQAYGHVGGPLRTKKENKPGEQTRTVWARGKAGYAQAS